MTNRELVLNMLAEVSTKDISEAEIPILLPNTLKLQNAAATWQKPPVNNWKKS